MALRHRGFLLDAEGFKEKIAPILAMLEVGDAQPLFEQALMVVEQTMPNQWSLELAGSSLLDIRKVNYSLSWPQKESIENRLRNSASIHPYDIGYWLLLFFSTFVQICPGIGGNYSILDGVLCMLGWSQEETRLLIEGTSTVVLLKPDATPVHLVSEDSLPYWYCMRPLNGYAAGWLSKEQIADLYRHLLSEKQIIQAFDHKSFGNNFMGWPLTVPEGQVDYLKRLQAAYERAIMMLEAAQEAGTELYVTLSYV